MPTRQGNLPGSGCRADCLHRAMVLAYRATRSEAVEVRKAERELACNGFEAEGRAWDEEHPPAITFRDYLINMREVAVRDTEERLSFEKEWDRRVEEGWKRNSKPPPEPNMPGHVYPPSIIGTRPSLTDNAQKSRVVDTDRPTAQEAPEMITPTTPTGEARFSLTGAPTDAALATWSIEARNAYLDEIAAEADLAEWDEDTDCQGHESLAGEHMGEAVYCDGSCVQLRRR